MELVTGIWERRNQVILSLFIIITSHLCAHKVIGVSLNNNTNGSVNILNDMHMCMHAIYAQRSVYFSFWAMLFLPCVVIWLCVFARSRQVACISTPAE